MAHWRCSIHTPPLESNLVLNHTATKAASAGGGRRKGDPRCVSIDLDQPMRHWNHLRSAPTIWIARLAITSVFATAVLI